MELYAKSTAVDPYDGAISGQFIFEDGFEFVNDVFITLFVLEREDRVEGDHRFLAAAQDAEVVKTRVGIHRLEVYEHASAKIDRLVVVYIDGIDVDQAGHSEFSVKLRLQMIDDLMGLHERKVGRDLRVPD